MKTLTKTILYLVLSLSFLACQTTEKKNTESKKNSSIEKVDDAVNWFVMGDFGRNGDEGQQAVADQMQAVSVEIEPDFIIGVGDNFYPNGVASVQDPYWISSFENIYKGFGLFCPWYVVLGNHDYRGNYQAQIDYTNISQRWHMPAQYFVQEIKEESVNIKMVFIDSNPFEDKYYQEEIYKAVWSQDSTKQLLWMDSVLSDNSADWKIVIGHHPLYSGGKRVSETQEVRGHLEKVLKKHEVDVYFAGHEHDLQHIKNPTYKTHHVVSGAGSETRETGMMEYSLFAESVNGFVLASATKKQLLLQYINVKGDVIYKYSIEK